MASADRSVDIVAFLSDHLREILKRRLRELAGLALLLLALLGVIALATWSVQDPSFSHATQKPIRNLLGYPGAIFSDLAMQLLGLASVLLLAPEALIGWRLLTHRPLGERWRGLVWILVALLAAGFASTLPVIGKWPLPAGLGGAFGDAMLRVPAIIAGGTLKGFSAAIAGLAFGLATLVTFLIAAWAPRDADVQKPARKARAAEPELAEEEDEEEPAEQNEQDERDRASAWLGMIVHALLSLKARLMLIFRRSASAASDARSRERQEPRFDRLGRVAAPGIADDGSEPEDDDEEEEEEEEPAPRRKSVAPKPLARKSSGGFVLPSVNLLAAQKASDRPTLPKEIIDANAAALESVLQD